MFRTELPLTPHPQQLPHSARVLTIGSCFSDSIGSRLTEFKVATMANPFGTVFNPISACKLLRAAAGEDMDWQQHLVEARGRWQSHDLHAEIGADSPVELLQRIQTLTREAGVFLATADAVVLTLGSAFAYRLRETDELINNCHKLPADKFDKELLTADDIIAAVAETHAYLRRINPRLRFILTVSPVRHLKDTLVLNSASKSMLRVACHYLSELLPDVTYFPAYELLLDDLRDYRFYASDMLHPSEVAENYVWERFTRTYFDAAFGRFKKELESLRLALGHRPLYAGAPEHRQFLEATLERLRKISSQADVRMELLHVERELAALPLPTVPTASEPEYEDDGEERIDIGAYAEETPVSQPDEVVIRSQATPTRLPEAPSYSRATLLGKGAGILLETDEPDADDEPEEEERALPVPVATTPASAEVAYEHAYAAGLAEEQEADEEENEAEESLEEAGRRKKRRSRGGAKRTKRKHARLAAEAAASGTVTAQEKSDSFSAEPVAAPAEEQPESEPASAVVYITEEQLRQPTTVVDIPDTDAAEADVAEAPAAEESTRRSRNNRRDKRERPPRDSARSSRPPLYAESDAATTPAAAEFEVSSSVIGLPETPALPSLAAVLPEAAAIPAVEAQAEQPTAPVKTKAPAKPRTRKAPAQPKAAVVVTEETPVSIPEEPVAAVMEPAPAEAPETAAPVAPKPRRRAALRKPATAAPEAAAETPATAETAAPIVPAVAEPAAPESVPEPVAPTVARKRAPRKPKAAPSTVIPVPEPAPTPEPAANPEPAAESKPAVKRKPRPPRRKPSADAPETT